MEITLYRDFGIALLIGALVGLERERTAAPDAGTRSGGLRTFIVYAMIGALSAWLAREADSPWIFAVTVLAVALLVLTGYAMLLYRGDGGPGLTTEASAIAVTLLGGTALYGYPQVAVALGIALSALLAFKRPLHGLVAGIAWPELYAALKLLIASFIVLPLLPNRTIDPLEAINPYELWLLVILISGLSLVGFAAIRLAGERLGTALTGAIGGLASSTAVTLAYARQSRKSSLDGMLAAGVLFGWSVMFLRVAAIAGFVNPAIVPGLLVPIGALAISSGLGGLLVLLRARRGKFRPPHTDLDLRNPFSMTAAIQIALLVAAMFLLVSAVEQYLSGEGLYAVGALGGFANMDAITLSMARFADGGDTVRLAIDVLTIASLTSTGLKIGMTMVLGSPGFRRIVLWPAMATLAGGGLALLLQ